MIEYGSQWHPIFASTCNSTFQQMKDEFNQQEESLKKLEKYVQDYKMSGRSQAANRLEYQIQLLRVKYHTLTQKCLSHDMTKPTKWLCAQGRLRSAWAFPQYDQSLPCPHEESLGPWLPIECTAKTLIRLGGSPGWSESLLGAHSFCWFSHVAAHF